MVAFSFIFPSRERIQLCIESISSLYNLAADKRCFEVVMAFDDDDMKTKDEIEKFCKETGIQYQILITERYKYRGMHLYLNKLLKIIKGDYCCFWGDDIKMLTNEWDKLLMSEIIEDNISVFDFNNNHYPWISSMVPKKYLTAMKHFSVILNADSWIEGIFRYILDIGKPSKYINIYHHRKDPEYSHIYGEATIEAEINSYNLNDSLLRTLRIMDVNRVIKNCYPNYRLFTLQKNEACKIVGYIGVNKRSLKLAFNTNDKRHIVSCYDHTKHFNSAINPIEIYNSYNDNKYDNFINYESRIRFLDDLEDIIEISEILFLDFSNDSNIAFNHLEHNPDNENNPNNIDILCNIIDYINNVCKSLNKIIRVVINYNIEPGTYNKYIKPLLTPNIIIYYIPEIDTNINKDLRFIGCNSLEDVSFIDDFYKTIDDKNAYINNIEIIEILNDSLKINEEYNKIIQSKILEFCNKHNINADIILKIIKIINSLEFINKFR